jgi:hypothetical protein
MTTVSDVYSLGVVLYEVMTGRLPYEVNKYSAEWIISQETPKRPSTIRKGIDRDVDAIVLKALEKNPARRYQSVASFAEDIERHLSGRPILAHPPSPLYQMRKFVVRYRWGVLLLACGIAGGLGLGFLLKSWDQRIANEKQRNLANRLYFLGRSMIRNGDYLTAEGILRYVIDIEKDLPSEQDWRGAWLLAERRLSLAQCLLAQGEQKKDEARELFALSYPPLKIAFGSTDRRIREARQRIIDLYKSSGELEKAYQILGEPLPPPDVEPTPTSQTVDQQPTSQPA